VTKSRQNRDRLRDAGARHCSSGIFSAAVGPSGGSTIAKWLVQHGMDSAKGLSRVRCSEVPGRPSTNLPSRSDRRVLRASVIDRWDLEDATEHDVDVYLRTVDA
jgi:hypothetical protein